ncbi:MAG TPA: DUF1993 family protein [Burkholderiaceae bacterium]|nr:DUF1993 family protein [Burkholderiaceae bacterium]
MFTRGGVAAAGSSGPADCARAPRDGAQAHAEAKKFDPSVYLAARLAPDMLPFTNQIQMACDGAKFAVARLSGPNGVELGKMGYLGPLQA